MTSPVSMPAGHAIVAADMDAYENATGVWSTWNPTLANLTLGNGTVTAKYRQVGKTVDYRFKFKLGSTSAVGTNPTFTPPVAAHADYAADEDRVGTALFNDAGSAIYNGISYFRGGGVFALFVSGSGTIAGGLVSATVPFTWGTGDVMTAYGTYEAA